MLFYIIQNFERIVFSFVYFLFFTYFFSYATVLYHDGISSVVLYKNPVVLYRRVFQIIKWYYYNRDALTAARIALLSLMGLGTLVLQSIICRIPWRSYGGNILRIFFNGIWGFFSHVPREDSVNLPGCIEVEKEKFILSVERIADGILYDFLKLQNSPSGITEEGVSRIKEVSIMRIGYEIEDLISGIVVRQDLEKNGDGLSQ